MARDITYLTVQDHLWINLQVTKQKYDFNFATLEEAVYYQYGYGKSTDVLAQAARYVGGFAKKSPFQAGNEATGFVGLLTFLQVNGYDVTLTDAKGAAFLDELAADPKGIEAALSKITHVSHHDHHDHHASVAVVAAGVIETYPKTLAKLSKVTA